MARIRTPNQKKAYGALNKRLLQYVAQVQSIYDMANRKMAEIAVSTGYDGTEVFSFKDYPEFAEAVKDVQAQFVSEMRTTIYRGTGEEWRQSNLIQDLLAEKVLKSYSAQVHGKRYKQYFQTNSDALKAFQNRADKGMNLSAKLWNQSALYKEEMEAAISTAIQKGMSAQTLSKRLSVYLEDFPKLQKDYRERFGRACICNDCEYRSIRLARSEINMAYRTAEQTRWKQFDFIVGYEIKLSGSHPHPDICDDLKGRYPKDFDWTGWHPNDMCYAIPIIMSEDEYWNEGDRSQSDEMITELPENFKDYVRDNKKRLMAFEENGTSPYWYRDNREYIQPLFKKSYEMTAGDVEELERVHGFNRYEYMRFKADSYNSSAMGGFDLLRFDDSFEGICDRYAVKLKSKDCYMYGGGGGNAELNYTGWTESGEKVELVRNFIFSDGKRIVQHSKFSLPESLQGKGISKEVFRGLFKEYSDMDLSRIEVTANMDVGGYCWARYGFCAQKTDAASLVGEVFKKGKISKVEYDEALSIINRYDKDVFPMNLLSELPYAERMLKGESWSGFLDFKDRVQVNYMKDYIGYSK